MRQRRRGQLQLLQVGVGACAAVGCLTCLIVLYDVCGQSGVAVSVRAGWSTQRRREQLRLLQVSTVTLSVRRSCCLTVTWSANLD
jgi:hypothetical protein